MKQHSFYFRCKACNRPLSNHGRKDSDGTIKESDLCTICTNIAFDDFPNKTYAHQQISDEVTCLEKYEEFLE